MAPPDLGSRKRRCPGTRIKFHRGLSNGCLGAVRIDYPETVAGDPMYAWTGHILVAAPSSTWTAVAASRDRRGQRPALGRYVESHTGISKQLVLDLRAVDFAGTPAFTAMYYISVHCARTDVDWTTSASAAARRLATCDHRGSAATRRPVPSGRAGQIATRSATIASNRPCRPAARLPGQGHKPAPDYWFALAANTIAGAMTADALAAPPTADTPPPGRITAEAGRRRTFAVISHPDAGKSTLTEALALHARAITEAGAVHGKAGRRATVSDWMEMEKARGISITSTALQFPYRDCRHQPARHPGPRRLLRRHLPGADGRRLRGDAHRRRERP